MIQEDTSYPKLFHRCKSAYRALYNRSHEIEADEDEIHVIFVGSMTEVMFDVDGINTGNYGSVSKKLQDMGCIEIVHKGSGHTPSTVRLHFEPQEQMYVSSKRKLTKSKEAEMRQRMVALENRISNLEIRLGKLDGRVAAPIELNYES